VGSAPGSPGRRKDLFGQDSGLYEAEGGCRWIRLCKDMASAAPPTMHHQHIPVATQDLRYHQRIGAHRISPAAWPPSFSGWTELIAVFGLISSSHVCWISDGTFLSSPASDPQSAVACEILSLMSFP
jgi:hypothetical protein